MHRADCDPENMTAEDFLCDFCLNHWREDRHMVEGHRGNLICSQCLAIGYREVILDETGADAPPGATCSLCLAEKKGGHWRSPLRDEPVLACRACLARSATLLEKDPESNWSRPGGRKMEPVDPDE